MGDDFMVTKLPKYKLYHVFKSELIKRIVPDEHIEECLTRHRTGDYAILSEEDWQCNEDAIKDKKGYILSCYEYITPEGEYDELYNETDLDSKYTSVTQVDE